MSEDEFPAASQNPNASPQADISLPEETSIWSDTLLEGDLRAFVGRKANYYLGKWYARLNSSKAPTGFNWAAFLLSTFWFPYRRMFRVTFIFYGFLLAKSVAEDVVFLGMLQMDDIPSRWIGLSNIAIAATCGMLGNRLYMYHAMRVVGDVRAVESRDEIARHSIAQRGGTSLLAAIGCGLLFLVIGVAVVVMTDVMIFGI